MSEPPAATAGSFAIPRPRRLLSVGHSYVVALNRRLAHEMALAGRGRWEVTAAAPQFFHGDLRPIALESFAGEACELVPVPVRFSKKIHVMLYGAPLRRLIRSRPWDLVHCWEEPYVFPGFQVARWTPRPIPFVFWTMQNVTKNYPPPFRWIERYCLDRCSGWFALGHSVVDALTAKGYGSKPHRIVSLGVDLDRFQIDREARERSLTALGWSDPGPPVVGFVGRMVPEKGIGLLMRALDRVEVPWRVLFLGGGPMEAEVRAWSARYPGRVVIASVKHDDVPAYVNAMDLLAAPSQTTRFWREQFGRMLIEAFACGVPVVASDSGEIPHVVGDAGRIVPEADESAWVVALTELLSDPAARAELRARGLDRARTQYAWPVIAKRHLDFFDEILDSAPAARA